MSTKTATKPSTAGRELVTSRILNAPRDLVWQAWTDPAHFTHWWGPNGFSTSSNEFAFKPGGVWRFIMHGPDGRDYPNVIVFEEIVKPERITYKHAGEQEFDGVKFEAGVSFEDLGGKTRVTLHSLFATPEELDYVVKEFGAIEGAEQTLERLERFVTMQLPALSKGVVITFPSDNEARMERIVDAPRELVFDVWTNPKHIPQWMLGPEGWTMPVCEADLRPGGKWHYVWRQPEGTQMEMTGVFKEVQPPARLVSTENWGEPWPESVNTIEFTEQNGKTKITLTILYPSKEARDQAVATGMADGAGRTFELLDALVQRLKAEVRK